MPQKIILDDIPFFIVHKTNKRIKRVSLILEPQNQIVIKTPLKFKTHLLKEIVLENKDWILRSIHRVKPINKFDFITGGKIPFLGKQYDLVIKQSDDIKHIKVKFEDDKFTFLCADIDQSYDEFKLALELFYKYNAKTIIDPIFKVWCEKTSLYPTKIGYRKAKTRWGSCSYKNSISINYMLLQFDKKAIEYVVLHELCHIKEKNHSKKFWDMVSFYMSDYKIIQKSLKNGIL